MSKEDLPWKQLRDYVVHELQALADPMGGHYFWEFLFIFYFLDKFYLTSIEI